MCRGDTAHIVTPLITRVFITPNILHKWDWLGDFQWELQIFPTLRRFCVRVCVSVTHAPNERYWQERAGLSDKSV